MQKWKIDKNWLKRKYTVEKMSTRNIALLVGCNSNTIYLRLVEYGIHVRTKKESMRDRRTGDTFNCANGCGREIYRKGYSVKISKFFYCSWECEKQHQSKIRRKSLFKNGWRSYGEYRRWRKQVLSRDGECKLCYSKNKLVSHHILEAQDFPELVYDINNGVALCQLCHIEVHRNDSTQFIKPLQEAILVE